MRITRSRWIVAVAAVGCLAFVTAWTTFLYQVVRVAGVSMTPTLKPNDRVIANKWIYLVSIPHRGDVVMMRYPRDPSKTFVERVIAQGGDRVRIEDGRVYVNGDAVQEQGYVAAQWRSGETIAERLIEQGQYFVLGDRRNNSSDSREWGSVPQSLVIGKITFRWFPTVGEIR